MSRVVELEDYRPNWDAGHAECQGCGKIWTAIYHKDKRSGLECPQCGEMEGELSWED